jgi:hypothetical protein
MSYEKVLVTHTQSLSFLTCREPTIKILVTQPPRNTDTYKHPLKYNHDAVMCIIFCIFSNNAGVTKAILPQILSELIK